MFRDHKGQSGAMTMFIGTNSRREASAALQLAAVIGPFCRRLVWEWTRVDRFILWISLKEQPPVLRG